MSDMTAELIAFLQEHYSAGEVRLHTLSQVDDRVVYRLERATGAPWALRRYPIARAAVAHAQASVLHFLEAHAYPSERLIPTRAGALVCVSPDSALIVTTFLIGRPLTYEPPALYRLGENLGRLHQLAAPDMQPIQTMFPAAAMRPAPELAYARGELTAVADRLLPTQQAGYATLLQAIDGLDRCEALPAVLIHNDYHPGNAVDVDGAATLIDWEGAGAGAAILDVGFLLASCDTESPWTPRLPPDQGRVAAIVDGYCEYHQLSDLELASLADAIRFRALVYGACSFGAAARRGVSVLFDEWWWRRYQAADEIAERAADRFRRNR